MAAQFHTDVSSLTSSPDVVIVGAGIVGLASAFFLKQQGLQVAIVERLPTPAALTSSRSGEGVRAQWELPHNIAIARRSIEFYRDFEQQLGSRNSTAGYRPVGYLYASRTSDGAARLHARHGRQVAAGLDDVEYIPGGEAQKRFPLLSSDVQAAVFRAADGVVDVSEIVRGYLSAMDVDIILNTDVLQIARKGDEIAVETTAGLLSAPTVVLANGARLPAMLAGLDLPLPLKVARSTILRLKTEGIPHDHPATIDADLGSFWRPDSGGARITASFRSTLFVDRFTDDPTPDPDYLAHAIATVTPLVPLWKTLAPNISDSHVRNGTFCVSGDGAPVIGPIADFPGLYVNGAYGGHGIMMSPDGARRLAQMIVSGEARAGNLFHPSRFADGAMPPAEPMTINTNDAPKES